MTRTTCFAFLFERRFPIGLLKGAAVGSLVVVLAACTKKESIDSADVTTHGTSLEFEVTNDGKSSNVYAAIHVGSWESNTWARLSAGDKLILKPPSGDARVLPVTTSADKTSYGANIAPVVEGTFTLDFVREKGVSALNNTLVVPPPFELTALPAEVPRAEALTLKWNAGTGGYSTSVRLTGDCITLVSKDVTGDPGTFTLNAGEIKPSAGKETQSCVVTVRMTREISSTTCCSAEFGHPSKATGQQLRVATFSSKP